MRILKWNNPEDRPKSGQKIIFNDAVGLGWGVFQTLGSGVIYIENKRNDKIMFNDVYEWIDYPEDNSKKDTKHVVSIEDAINAYRIAFNKKDGFKDTYIANIAMAFKDEYSRWKKKKKGVNLNFNDIHKIANIAAENFINLWMKK